MKTERIKTDLLIIGGGTAGCYGEITAAENPALKILICEKSNIKRSGCLAAGVNALNAYIVEGRKHEDYVAYARNDAAGIVREDLLLSMSRRLHEVTRRLEEMGLVILKDEKGNYIARGNRNLKINGENIKPILAEAVAKLPNVTVLNRVNITDFSVENNRIKGALKWIESGMPPSEQNVEIEGTEPYIVGGHTASGYWVDTKRATTIKGLFAAGDVAGGCPQKYVTGALAEGKIAANSAAEYLSGNSSTAISEKEISDRIAEINRFIGEDKSDFTAEQLEEAMQTVMDSYAGGIKTNYRFNEKQLSIADYRIKQLEKLSDKLHANDFQELMYIYELRDGLRFAEALSTTLKHVTKPAGTALRKIWTIPKWTIRTGKNTLIPALKTGK